jgi:hypothetical protein
LNGVLASRLRLDASAVGRVLCVPWALMERRSGLDPLSTAALLMFEKKCGAARSHAALKPSNGWWGALCMCLTA